LGLQAFGGQGKRTLWFGARFLASKVRRRMVGPEGRDSWQDAPAAAIDRAAGRGDPLLVGRSRFQNGQDFACRFRFARGSIPGYRFPVPATPSAIIGDVSGRTQSVISTGSVKEDQHFHLIEATGVALEDLILSGTENNEPGEHSHLVSIE
jgi:hypothetical protein